jgi:mannose-6-phosphate isomerase-like protein (cupin superfamily)
MLEIYPVSEVYSPPEHQKAIDVAPTPHYLGWMYRLAEIVEPDGSSIPEGGNTVVFNLPPGAMTEPVWVAKPQEEATFKVSVVRGTGKLIRANDVGEVEHSKLDPGVTVTIRPGDMYCYHNDGNENLILHDVAVPAYEEGDDAQLYLMPSRSLPQREGYNSCEIPGPNGERAVVYVPQRFTNLVANAMRSPVA